MAGLQIFAGGYQGEDDRQAREADRGGGEEGRANSRIAGAFLRPLFLRRAKRQVVRADGKRAGRSHACADAEAGEEIQDGAGDSGLREGNGGSIFQHRGCVRCRRHLSGEISQAPYSALPPRVLGEILFHARECGVSRVSDAFWKSRRLHLLRPALSRGGADSGLERRGDRVQSVGYRGRAFRIPVGARTAGACGGQSVFCGGHQSRGHREAVEHRGILRQELFLQSARENRGAGEPGQGRAGGRGPRFRRDSRGARDVAVLSRPPAGKLRRNRAHPAAGGRAGCGLRMEGAWMTTATATAPLCRNFINGRWVESRSGQTIERRNPANLMEVTSVAPLSTRAEVREAIAAAKAAFPGWRGTPAPTRGKILARAAALMEAQKEA